MTATVMQVFW